MEPSKEEKPISNALKISLISVSAALYAAAIAATSFIPTPWGVGNFRPGVLIPAFFAIVYGPLIGGGGAAIGCFIGDLALSAFGLTNPLLSLVAGVPANLAGFYLLGWFFSRYPSWSAFVVSSFASLVVGNLIAALGVVGFYSIVEPYWAPWPMDVKIATVIGFTFFWVATMIPFVIPLMPPLLRSVRPVLGASGGNLNIKEIAWGKPTGMLKSTIIVSLILAALYAIVMYTPLGDLAFSTALYKETTFWVKTFILISSAVIIAFGLATAIFIQQKEHSWVFRSENAESSEDR